MNFYFFTLNDLISLTPGIVLIMASQKIREAVVGKKILKIYTGKPNNSTTILVVSQKAAA
jgi:hypothetical protein